MSETNVAVDRRVGRPVPERAKTTPLMRSMLMRASHITPPRSTLVTEHVGGVCVQCEGRPTFRNTLDGTQPTISFHWFIGCKRASKADVWRLTSADDSKTPNDGGNARHDDA